MPGFFLLFDEEVQAGVVPCKEIRVSLDKYGPIRNKRTKYDKTDLTVYKGDTEMYAFTAYSGQKVASLLGYQIRAQARKTPNSPELLFDVHIYDGDYGADFSKGRFVMKLPPSVTNDLPSLCRYDIQGVLGSDVITLVSGSIKVHKDVVKP